MIYLLLIDADTDRRKFEIIYRKYRRLMAMVAFDVLHNYNDVEDVLHDSFVKIANNMDCIKEAESKETRNFVSVIAKHTALDYYRKNRRRQKREFTVEKLSEHQIPRQYIKDHEEEFGRIMKVLLDLPQDYKEVLMLRYVNCLQDKEIAKVLGLQEGTVRMRISRGKKLIEVALNSKDKE